MPSEKEIIRTWEIVHEKELFILDISVFKPLTLCNVYFNFAVLLEAEIQPLGSIKL